MFLAVKAHSIGPKKKEISEYPPPIVSLKNRIQAGRERLLGTPAAAGAQGALWVTRHGSWNDYEVGVHLAEDLAPEHFAEKCSA